MLARYLLVRGVPGRLVANPHVPAHARRFLGKMPNGVFWDAGPVDPETGQPRWPAAVPVEEVVLDHPDIHKAANGSRGDLTTPSKRGPASQGDIEILGKITACSIEEARKKLIPAKAPRTEK
jgi:hypothetical protein